MTMRTPRLTVHWFGLAVVALLATFPAGSQTQLAANSTANKSEPIPMDQLGAAAGKQYQGDGLSVAGAAEGARLRCVFQRLEGQVTREGLWLTSTAEHASGERFRVVAVAVGRAAEKRSAAVCESSAAAFLDSLMGRGWCSDHSRAPLATTGKVVTADRLARFIRPGLTEEYSVSVDGVRKDFIVEQRPEGEGELRVELDVTSAKAEPLVNGARLVLDGSGRKLAYHRLRVVDATGRELPARMEVTAEGARRSRRFDAEEIVSVANSPDAMDYCTLKQSEDIAPVLAVVVDDAAAVYPVRIDPTFSDADWISMGGIPGADGTVEAAVVDGAGILYIGGSFTVVGEVPANRVAKWIGSSWSALGSGVDSTVYALAVSGSDVYAGGWFTTAGGNVANHIAKWNGTSWSALGSGLNDPVEVLVLAGSDLYAGGWFTLATNTGGTTVTANGIAKWNGNSWSALGKGMNGWVYALAVSGNELFVGGSFTWATNTGGTTVTANSIAKWNGSAWSALGTGLTDTYYPWRSVVNALAMSGCDLYAGGYFTKATSGVTATNVAEWNGSSWSALGLGITGGIHALAVSGAQLYAGGIIETAGGVPANNIAVWNGSNWSALGSGLRGTYGHVYALAVLGSDVYAGGAFTMAGGNAANYIAKWNGSSWSALALGSGINGRVSALAVLGSDLYAGGEFTMAGSVAANYITKWNGSSWSALGSGISAPADYPYSGGHVSALAVSGSDVFAGGYFTTAGGNPANSIAKWNGSSWSALGLGLDNRVNALAVSGTDLYLGGQFTTATNTGGATVTVNHVATWNGSAWSPLGLGMNDEVDALAVSGGEVYAGGWFTTADGSAANYIAKWNGTNWSALDQGMDGGVYALVVSGSSLYAGGLFTTAGGVPAANIARWDGGAWLALDSGLIDPDNHF